jgi:hypothetical protein
MMHDRPAQFADSWTAHPPQASANGGYATQPPPQVRSVRAKLKTVSDCSHQLAVLYREARSGKLDVSDASKLANILYILSRTLTDSEIESRLESLERNRY